MLVILKQSPRSIMGQAESVASVVNTLRCLKAFVREIPVFVERDRLGHPDAAPKKAFESAVPGFDWSESKAINRDLWRCHLLRREAEAAMSAAPDKPSTPEPHPWQPNGRQSGLRTSASARDSNSLSADSSVFGSHTPLRPSRSFLASAVCPRKSLRVVSPVALMANGAAIQRN